MDTMCLSVRSTAAHDRLSAQSQTVTRDLDLLQALMERCFLQHLPMAVINRGASSSNSTAGQYLHTVGPILGELVQLRLEQVLASADRLSEMARDSAWQTFAHDEAEKRQKLMNIDGAQLQVHTMIDNVQNLFQSAVFWVEMVNIRIAAEMN